MSEKEAASLDYPSALNCPEREQDFLALHRCDWGAAQPYSEDFIFEKRQITFTAFYLKQISIFFKKRFYKIKNYCNANSDWNNLLEAGHKNSFTEESEYHSEKCISNYSSEIIKYSFKQKI